MKFDYSKKVKFWSDDLNVATGVALIGFVITMIVSSTKFLKDFVGLGTYIACLIVLWGALSGFKIMAGKPNTIALGKMIFLIIPCILFMIVIIIFG